MKRIQGSSIFKRIWIPLLLLVVLQAALLMVVFLGGGVLETLNQNAIDIVNEKTINRAEYLQKEMVERWSNLDNYVEELNQLAQKYVEERPEEFRNMEKSSDTYVSFLDDSMETLISLMRSNSVNGAFLVLNQEDLSNDIKDKKYENKPGIYLRDYDPVTFPSKKNTDLMAERMPESLVKKWKISTDSGWRDKFLFDGLEGGYYPFLKETYQTALKYPKMDTKDLGYWSEVYQLHGDNNEAISYSVPLRLEDGTVYGVLGIEITLDYLKKINPYGELAKNRIGAYVLGIEKGNSSQIQSVMVNGPVVPMLVKNQNKFQLEELPEYENVYAIKGKKNELLCSEKQYLSLYNSNTPYEEQKWVLTGISRKSYLFRFSNNVGRLLMMLVAIMFVLSVLSVTMVTFLVSRPVKNLADEINRSNPEKPIQLPVTSIQELDYLGKSVERLSQDLFESSHKFTQILKMASTRIGGFEIDRITDKLFITDDFFRIFYSEPSKPNPRSVEEFKVQMEKLEEFLYEKDKNIYIFRVPQNGSNCWIRLTLQIETNKIMGLAEDITKETLELHQMEYERDHDILTGIINRRAFYRRMEKFFTTDCEVVKKAAMVMIDLDNLKNINDTYGHEYGDQYIKVAAENIVKCAPKNSIVARMSGDEFIVFIYGYESEKAAKEDIEESSRQFQREVLKVPDGKEIHIHMSGGIAWYPKHSKDYHQLIKFADRAMYAAKKRGKGVFEEFLDRELMQ